MSVQFVRIWNADDGGKSAIHIVSSGMDYTICGHDCVEGEGDPVAHLKPCKILEGRHRVTCPMCLRIINDCRNYIALWKKGQP